MSTSRHWDGFDDETPEPDMPHSTCAKGHIMHEYEATCITCRLEDAEAKLSKLKTFQEEALEWKAKAEKLEIMLIEAEYLAKKGASRSRCTGWQCYWSEPFDKRICSCGAESYEKSVEAYLKKYGR